MTVDALLLIDLLTARGLRVRIDAIGDRTRLSLAGQRERAKERTVQSDACGRGGRRLSPVHHGADYSLRLPLVFGSISTPTDALAAVEAEEDTCASLPRFRRR